MLSWKSNRDHALGLCNPPDRMLAPKVASAWGKKPISKGYILYYSLYITFSTSQNVSNGGQIRDRLDGDGMGVWS